jgi:hypothetical protein
MPLLQTKNFLLALAVLSVSVIVVVGPQTPPDPVPGMPPPQVPTIVVTALSL